MKIQILLLVCVCAFCSCQIMQNAQTSDLSNKISGNQQVNVNSPVLKKTDVKQIKTVNTSRFSSVKIERTDKNNEYSLDINIEYPQLKNLKITQEKQFNQFVKKQVDDQIRDFKKYLTERHEERKFKGKYEINLSYTVDYYSDNFTSVVMNWNGYSGYLNMDYFPSTINFDLKKGTATELKDIFEPNANYLNKLSELAIATLKRTCLSCGCGNDIHAGDPLPEGEENKGNQGGMFDLTEAVSAKEKNFYNWSVTAEGLRITFNEYQVAPGCAGIINIIIPFSDLQPILRKDLNFSS